LLLNLNKKLFLLALVVAIFTGCSNRYSYTNKSYHSSTKYKSNNYNKRVYKKTRSTHTAHSTQGSNNQTTITSTGKIRNSKAMHRATMRPYEVFGKKYYPTVARINDKFNGIASWYGPKFHAKKTSNGEIYNMYAETAAHKTLPMNTIVKVYNVENGKSTVVRINDRGPFVAGRIIDLSNKAAHAIDMVKKGTAKVKLTVLGFNGKIATTLAEKNEVRTVSNYYVQVGVFSKIEGANITKRKFEMILEKDYKVILKDGKLDDKEIKRVWISGFRSEQEAQDFKETNNLQRAMVIAQ